MTNHPFDLTGIDTSKIGGNKYVNYKMSDYLKDQNLNPSSGDLVLKSLNLDKDYLKRVPRTSVIGKVKDFLNLGGDYYLPTGITDRLAAADKVKTEKENFDPYGNLGKLLDYELNYKKAADLMDRKGRVTDRTLESALMRADLPYYADYFEDISRRKQQQLLDAEAIKQSLPNQIQKRIGESALATASLRNSLANVQDSATRFAGLGMQRPFGQPTFRVS